MTWDQIIEVALETLTVGLQWVVIPLILAGLVLVAWSMVNRARDEEQLTAGRAGWWAGLILFFLFFVHELPAFRPPAPGVEGGVTVDVWGVVAGTVLGFAVLWGMSFLSAARVVGFLVLFLTFAGLSSLLSYLFLETRNEFFIAGTLGTALGGLLHLIVFPGSLLVTKSDKDVDGTRHQEAPRPY